MSPPGQPPPGQSQAPADSSSRHGTTLPPIAPSQDANRTASESRSVSSAAPSPFSRAGSASSEGLNKMHHLLNPATGPEAGTKPSSPEPSSRRAPLPPLSLPRTRMSDHSTPLQSPYGSSGPTAPSHRLGVPNFASPTGTIDAKKSPFLPPGNSGSSMTTLAGPTSQTYGARSAYPFPHQAPQVAAGPRRGSDAPSAACSRTGSPTPSYSSYEQTSTAQGSPRSQYPTVAQHGSQVLFHGNVSRHASSPQLMHHSQEQFQPPHAQTVGPSNGTYRMMTIDTGDGPIQVPVDIQAASKMADEKRRRNAGASARFRQRRKEKEKESVATISKLEDKVNKLCEDRNYYRAERDYYRDLVYTTEGARAKLVPRMPSPVPTNDRIRHSSLASSRGGGTEGGLSPSSAATEYKELGERGSDDGRIARRRISAYEPDRATSSSYAPEKHFMHSTAHQACQHPQQGPPHPPPPPHAPMTPNSLGPPTGHHQYAFQRSVSGPAGHAPHMHPAPSVPQTMRTGPYEPHGHPPHMPYEMRWAAPS